MAKTLFVHLTQFDVSDLTNKKHPLSALISAPHEEKQKQLQTMLLDQIAFFAYANEKAMQEELSNMGVRSKAPVHLVAQIEIDEDILAKKKKDSAGKYSFMSPKPDEFKVTGFQLHDKNNKVTKYSCIKTELKPEPKKEIIWSLEKGKKEKPEPGREVEMQTKPLRPKSPSFKR